MLCRALLVSLLLLGASSAEAQIFQPGTQPLGQTGGITVPVQSSHACHTCHGGIDPDDDYEPWEGWRGSLMASAARDPVFRAALAIAEVDHADAADFCVRCHSPEAWLRGRSEVPEFDPSVTAVADQPRLRADDPTHAPSDDLDGVACMVCHRATDPTDAQLFNARLVLGDGPTDGELRYGPYAYAPGVEAGHPTGVSTFLPTSRLCGQCHDITSPLLMGHRVESSGVLDTTRPFAVERTFSEWRASAFAGRGQSCQSCHMPVVDHAVQVATFGSFPDTLRDGVSRHYLLGAASWQLRAIAQGIPDIAPGIAVHLTDNADRIEAFMQTSARVEIRASALSGTSASATVRVTNLTGHKLPTGYPEGRRMWLEIDVLDDTGASVAGSARYDAASGLIEDDAQARTYEAQFGVLGTDGSVTPGFHFVLSDTLVLDTRIPPEGFAPDASDDDAPLGRDYGDGAGGYRDYDETSYALTSLCGTGTLHLRARLRYQAATREYMAYLRDHAPASTDPALAGASWGQVAFQAWTDHGGATPIEIASAEVDLGASPMACPEPPDAGTDAGTNDLDAGDLDARADASSALDGGGGPPPASSSCGCRASRGTGGGAWIALIVLAWLFRSSRRSPV